MLPAIEGSHGVKVTHTDLLVAIVARTLTQHRRLNASWTAEGSFPTRTSTLRWRWLSRRRGHRGDPRADRAAVADIAVRRRDLAERARAGRLQPADVADATFTISNLGMFEVDAFHGDHRAAAGQPSPAVGAIADRVVPVDGAPGVRPMMSMTLSMRSPRGGRARAAAFMRDLAAAIGSPRNCSSMTDTFKNFVNGRWTSSRTGETFENENPAVKEAISDSSSRRAPMTSTRRSRRPTLAVSMLAPDAGDGAPAARIASFCDC